MHRWKVTFFSREVELLTFPSLLCNFSAEKFYVLSYFFNRVSLLNTPHTTKEPPTMSATPKEEVERKPVTVHKEIPLNFDLGLLSAYDPQPLDHLKISDSSKREQYLRETTRDNVQLLVNQILSLPLQKKDNITLVTLPDPLFKLPREKSIPKPKEPTRWEKFAAKKGIQKKGKEGKLVFDEESQKWVNKWGYKGINKKIDNQWAVEVASSDDKGNSEEALLDPRKLHRDERKTLIKKNLHQQKRNRESSA